MWFLKIGVVVLAHALPGHKPATEHHTVRLAYDTQYTCDEAEYLIDADAILTATNNHFKATKSRKWALKVTTACAPETNGLESDGNWHHDNRIYRP